MSQPIQLDPANEKFFLPQIIPFKKETRALESNIDEQLPVRAACVVIFKTDVQKR